MTALQMLRTLVSCCRRTRAMSACAIILIMGLTQSMLAQNGTNPLTIFKNYFVTGDYVVGGWVEGAPDGSGYAPGTITIPDPKQHQYLQSGVPEIVPKGAEIVAAYLYWATVESSQSTQAGKQAFFNSYAITGTTLGNLNAPVSWSSGGCSGSAQGSKTMRTYRADVRPYMPLDTDRTKPTFGALVGNGQFNVRLRDSGSNGNTAPFALGATLVVIYRVLSPPAPLNAIVLYDGSYAPSNSAQSVSQTLAGFYQPAIGPIAKLTHIVANGQMNKSEQVFLNNTSQPLLSIYGSAPPFPGIYGGTFGGTWDNPTWSLSALGDVKPTDVKEITSVVPSSSNSGCVSWGAMVLSTTVQDYDGDGLLDVWEDSQGYTDAVSSQWVALPGANKNFKDLFVEVDYLTDLDGTSTQHSHLPKQAALDAVGGVFLNQGINVHFDLGPNIYAGDKYVISYPVQIPKPLPPGTLAPQAGSGGNAILESAVVCSDALTPLCAFPSQPAIAWKGGVAALQADTSLGNFQPGRSHSYHYALFGHSLGDARSFWGTVGAGLKDPNTGFTDPTIPQLVSIVNTGTSTTVTLQSPSTPGFIKPGDCTSTTMPHPAACSIDSNTDRVTISGALGQPVLNGTYAVDVNSIVSTTNPDNSIKTMFTISGLPTGTTGTYTFGNEPQLGVAYMGPTSTSGHSDFGGGGDLAVTLGLWRADNPPGCDPSQLVSSCNDQVGTTDVQTGTLLHELGHTLTLTHGGTYYRDPDPNNPDVLTGVPTYEVNCKPNLLSTMNYLFQVRGFVDGGFDYSGQSLGPLVVNMNRVLNEASLIETTGLGVDVVTGLPAAHLTRWYSKPNALDNMLQNTAKSHCDGTPLAPLESAEVRVEGTPGSVQYPAALDWNNDFTIQTTALSPIDVNFNGNNGDSAFSGLNEWAILKDPSSVAFQQMSGRASAFGFSDGGGIKTFGGGIKTFGGGVDDDGGGIKTFGGGIKTFGGGIKTFGGGIEQDEDTATSTFTPPTGLTAVMSNKKVLLNWTAPTFGQVREYDIWRATGSFTLQCAVANPPTCAFSEIKVQLGTPLDTPPATTFTDGNVKNNTTYTYFVTDKNKQGARSGASAPVTIQVKF